MEEAQATDLFAGPKHPFSQGLLAATTCLTDTLTARMGVIPGTPRSGGALPGCPFAPCCAVRVAICDVQPAVVDGIGCHRGWPLRAMRHLKAGYAVPGRRFAKRRVLPIARDVSFSLEAGQTIGIARALIGGPLMVVCDAPGSALDMSIQMQVVNLLMDFQAQMGLALVFIRHDLAVVRHISPQIMVMCPGRVVELAPRDAFYARPMHHYAQGLMAAVPQPDPAREKGRRRC